MLLVLLMFPSLLSWYFHSLRDFYPEKPGVFKMYFSDYSLHQNPIFPNFQLVRLQGFSHFVSGLRISTPFWQMSYDRWMCVGGRDPFFCTVILDVGGGGGRWAGDEGLGGGGRGVNRWDGIKGYLGRRELWERCADRTATTSQLVGTFGSFNCPSEPLTSCWPVLSNHVAACRQLWQLQLPLWAPHKLLTGAQQPRRAACRQLRQLKLPLWAPHKLPSCLTQLLYTAV